MTLIAAGAWMHSQESHRASELKALRTRIGRSENSAGNAQLRTGAEFDRLEHRTREQINRLSDRLDRTEDEGIAERLLRNRLETVTARQDADRKMAVGVLKDRIEEIDARFDRTMSGFVQKVQQERTAFRRVQREWDSSIFLIHSRFKYMSRRDDGSEEENWGTGWGTGFIVSKNGHLVSNKHVVQPWKFDPELAAMAALGEVRIIEDSLRIAAWQSGSRCLNEDREPDLTVGFNNAGLENLELCLTAPDSMTPKTMEIGAASVEYDVHALDDNDLAILRIKNGKSRPVVCRRFSDAKSTLAKLDEVMALGFPRGQRGLETRVAETSPSLGTVRKIENTIHITASIIPGNSGGPLFTPDGVVVGVATRIYSETLGICLKIDHALDLMKQVRDRSATARPDAESAASRPAASLTGVLK